MEKECIRSPTGKHEWVYPRLEDSIDRNRSIIEPYCNYCFQKIKTKQMENLQKTIQKLQSTFKSNGLNFSGEEKDFWDMMNDLEVQQAIVGVIDKKIKEANSSPVRDLINGRFHC